MLVGDDVHIRLKHSALSNKLKIDVSLIIRYRPCSERTSFFEALCSEIPIKYDNKIPHF